MTDPKDLTEQVAAICEHEFDVLNCVTEACDGDRSRYDVDPHYWRKWLKITVEPSGRQLVW